MDYFANHTPPCSTELDANVFDPAGSDFSEPTAANGCDQPCPDCSSYYTCIIPGPHDGSHRCGNGHYW